MRLYADATGATLMELESGDAVLLGTAMLAAAASGIAPSLADATASMAGKLVSRPPDPGMAASLDRDYRVQRMMRAQREALDLVR
jgi:ribulose kinase